MTMETRNTMIENTFKWAQEAMADAKTETEKQNIVIACNITVNNIIAAYDIANATTETEKQNIMTACTQRVSDLIAAYGASNA